MHVLTNRTTRSPELMHLLRRVHFLIDSLGIDLTVRYIASKDNSQADALSRGSPFDELVLRRQAFDALDVRFGPHTVDRYATAANAHPVHSHQASVLADAKASACALVNSTDPTIQLSSNVLTSSSSR